MTRIYECVFFGSSKNYWDPALRRALPRSSWCSSFFDRYRAIDMTFAANRTFTVGEKARSPLHEAAFENLLRSANIHEDAIMVQHVEKINDRPQALGQ